MRLEVAQVNWKDKPTKRLHEILGNEFAKRALEVVLSGGHSVVFISTIRSPASDLLLAGVRIAEENGLPFKGFVMPVCECGAYGNPKVECQCSMAKINAHFRKVYPKVKDVGVFIETVEPRANETGKGYEQEEVFVSRVLEARKRLKPMVVDSDAEEMMKMGVREIGCDWGKTMAVAATVAAMDGSASIRAQHVSEALQYRYSLFTRWFDEAQSAEVGQTSAKTHENGDAVTVAAL